jgi:hypothetical protein
VKDWGQEEEETTQHPIGPRRWREWGGGGEITQQQQQQQLLSLFSFLPRNNIPTKKK